MQLNIVISLQISQGLKLFQSIILNMLELMYSNSRKYANRVTLTGRFKAWGRLLAIETRSWGFQQLIGMIRMAWDSLNLGNQFAIFLEFLQLCFLFYTPPTSFFLVCNCPLCIQEWIRVAICFKSSPIMIIDSWSLCKSFQIKQNAIFLYPYDPCTIWSHFQLYNRPKHAQNLKLWLVFDIFMILFWFYLI